MKLNRKNKKGFTIVELVIVIAVIGILAAILIPTFTNLTKNAQEQAKKQRVSDAYTVYLAEAVDRNYDLYTRTGDGSDDNPYKYKLATIEIQNKPQAQVALKLNNEWFAYDQGKGWNSYTPAAGKTPTQLICRNYTTDFTAALDLYDIEHNLKFQFAVEAGSAAKANLALSTFNEVVVYEYVA